ncbi:MAG: beta-propeller fold lactonase family protein [Methanolinea sp.]
MNVLRISIGILLLATSTSAAPFAYITNYGNDTVTVIDTATDYIIATVDVGSGPGGVAVSPDGTRVYVANFYSGTVSVIDTFTHTVIATVPVGANPDGVAVSPDGTLVYVANNSDVSVYVIDTETNTVIAVVPVRIIQGWYPEPNGVAVSPDGTRVYVGHKERDRISVIDPATNTIIAGVDVESSPKGIAVSPDGTLVYVANEGSNTVSVIDTATNAVNATVPVGLGPYGVTVSPDGTRVYVTNLRSNSVSVYDTVAHFVIATVPVGSNPRGVAITRDGTKVYVANSGGHTVSVIDTATNTVVDWVPTGSSPYAFGQFICSATPPKIQSILPAYGPAYGGTSVIITGTHFSATSAVTFGGQPATSFTVDSDTQVTAIAPPHEAGPVDVVVTTSGGLVTRKQSFTYREQPLPTPTIGSPPVGSTVEPTPIQTGTPLKADFTTTITSGVAPLTVQFQDTSQGNPTGWNWDLDGNGFKDYSEKNCEHTYTEPGTYTVSLSVTRDGELDSVIRADYIQVITKISGSWNFTFNLHPGWNFISVPYTLLEDHQTAGEVFSGVDTGGHSIFWFDASDQNWHLINPNDTLDPFKGIWVYSVSSAQVTCTLREEALMEPTVMLQPGWNAIGFNNLYSAGDGLYSVKDAWIQLIGYDSESQMYETSIINGGSGAHSDSNPVIPGKGYWVFMNEGAALFFSIYPLETDFPIVDESYPVYRTIIPNLTNEEIQQLGALFGVSGEVEDYIPSSGISRITDYSRDPYAIFEFNRNSGAYRYQIPDKVFSDSTSIQPDLPSDEEARIIATEYLQERDLFPADLHFSGVSIGSASGDSTHMFNLTKHVGFTREIAGIPVCNTGITVTIGEGGEVVGVTNSVRQYDPVPVRYMEIRTPVQAYERLRAGDLIMRPLCCTSYYAVRNISLGYWIEDTVSTQEYMLPVYAFACHEPSGTEEITLCVWAVDPADV